MSFGNVYLYLLFLFININITIFCVLFLKNKSEKFRYIFIFSLLLSAFILHFVKLVFEPYRSNFPKSLSSITFENICAVNTLIFPWVYLSKNKTLKDYLIVIGILSGLGTILVPYRSVGITKINFDIVRFYYDHLMLFLAPFLMLVTKQYHFNIRNIIKVPFVLYFVGIIILVNEVILIALGIINGSMDTLLDPNIRNQALIFGPNKAMSKFDFVYNPFVPEVFTKVPFGPKAGETLYWPIIWFVIPSYIYVILGGEVINLIFNVLLKTPIRLENTSRKLSEVDLNDKEIINLKI